MHDNFQRSPSLISVLRPIDRRVQSAPSSIEEHNINIVLQTALNQNML
jgi:hypothetical protein